ncbi:hypothetical protein [Breoghania sp.]|nr:hypothetical protein [Breoghania sp.]MDJ0931478.1 hypothetical protein [Breoghania sp.]
MIRRLPSFASLVMAMLLFLTPTLCAHAAVDKPATERAFHS